MNSCSVVARIFKASLKENTKGDCACVCHKVKGWWPVICLHNSKYACECVSAFFPYLDLHISCTILQLFRACPR